jgi:hypothetical protein
LLLCGLVISGTAADDQTCKAKAARQKLAGEALISFVKNCESDAYMACAEQAVGKMLAGPASDRFNEIELLKVNSAANIGSGPSPLADIIGIAYAGAEVLVASRDSGWVQIIDPWSSRTGWIYSKLLAPLAMPSAPAGAILG